MPEPVHDIAVIGAGAAGLMTAISAGREAARRHKKISIILFDTKNKIGAKILISGGTRCNVTNTSVKATDYEGGAAHFIRHVLEAFKPEQVRALFSEIGVELVLEPTGKYFPVTNSGRTVLEALIKETKRLGVDLRQNNRIESIQKKGDSFVLTGSAPGDRVEAKTVILATGGLSYPETGSDGTGYRIARSLGHSLVPTHAALTPLLSKDSDWAGISGVTMNVTLSFYKNGRKEKERSGSFLFTHFGFSGPAALDISRFWAIHASNSEVAIRASFLPSEKEESFIKKIEREAGASSNQFLKNFLAGFGLTQSFVEVLLRKIGIDGRISVRDLHRKDRTRLVQGLFYYPLEVTGVYGYKKAEVTAGGIDLGEVRVGTLESKKTPGLYLAGEILDVDGRIGGFNFQWAWSTGWIAGMSAARTVLK